MALDLYAWSTDRTFRINQDGREAFIPWRGLMKRFGDDHGDVKDFNRRVKSSLCKVQAVFSGLVLEVVSGRLVLC